MIFSSISATRTTRDPLPWLWPDGRRTADPGPLDWVELGGGARLRPSRARYSPRTHPPYRPRVYHRANPILDLSRDDDWHDAWGTALAWFFPCAAVLEYLGEPVPSEWGYRSSVAGAGSDLADGSWPSSQVVDVLELGEVVELPFGEPEVHLFDPDAVSYEAWNLAGEYARHAGNVFHRLCEAVPHADRY